MSLLEGVRPAASSRLAEEIFDKLRTALRNSPNGRACALVAGAVVLWASWPALATIAYPAPAFLVLGLAALIGCAVSFVIAVVRRRQGSFVSVPPRTLVFVALGLMGNNAFYLAAIARIGPAEANVVHYLWPVFLVLLAALVHRRLPSLVQFLGVTCGFCGVAMALSPQMGTGFDPAGVLLGACGALTFAIYSVVRSLAKVETDVVGPSLGLAGVSALLAHFVLEPAYWPTAVQWLAIIAMGIGPFTLANVLWDKATRQGTAATISSLAFLTPLVALGLLAMFGLSVVTLPLLLGALMTIVGAGLGSRR